MNDFLADNINDGIKAREAMRICSPSDAADIVLRRIGKEWQVSRESYDGSGYQFRGRGLDAEIDGPYLKINVTNGRNPGFRIVNGSVRILAKGAMVKRSIA